MIQAEQVLVHPREAEAARPTSAAARRAASAVDFAVYADLSTIEREWRAFERTADCTVFQSFDWLSTWQRHVGTRDGVQPAIVVGRRSGAISFILPLAVRRSGPVMQLAFLGRDLCDYNAPLLAPDYTDAAGAGFPALWQDIRAALARDPLYRHDVILLDKLPEMVGSQRNPLTELEIALNPSGAYMMALSGDWNAFYQSKRSSATRRRDRTKRKRLAESGSVNMVTPDTPEARAATLDILIAQKTRAFARMGVADMFARAGYSEFFADMATSTHARDLVHLSRLDVGDTAAATNFGLMFRGGYYHVLASYDDGPLARFGPGAAHLHDIMRYALDHGCRFFDFTIGDEPYKRDWADTELKLFDHVAAATLRGRVMAAGVGAARRIKRTIKQSQWLWPAALQLRAWLAAARKSLPR